MIRPLTPGDLWILRRKPRSQVMLYNETMLVRPHRPFWFSVRCALEGSRRDGATFVYRERGSRAAVQAVGRSGRPEQDIVMMSAYGDGRGQPTDPDIWFRILEVLCASAGQHRLQRLYAALSERHEELREIFRQLGFAGFTQQTVMRLEGPDWDQGITLAPMRPQARRDAWAIHKLYGATTPHTVQQAEARVARDWTLPLTRGWRRPRRRAWVLGPEDNLTTYLHLISGPVAHVLTLLVQPEARAITTDILRFGLGQISDSLPVYLLLREYQRELLLPAADLGFQPIGEQALLFKQTTAAVRRPFLMPVREPTTEPRAPIPTITSRTEEARRYVRTTRYHQ
ncbi:MAG: hypothetical protein ACJ8CR_04475 [Roseiflexaceae bacterium]